MKTNPILMKKLAVWPIFVMMLCVIPVSLRADDTTPDQVPDQTPKQKAENFDYQGAIDDICVEELHLHLAWLAAPEQEGRNSGSEAGHRAGDYLVMQLALLGLEPAGTDGSFTQGFRFRNGEPRYRNVLGVIPGSDPELADEYVMICAHYDHVGVIAGEVYPGANDNASGTSMILELAESLQKIEPRPKRSIIVAFWDAEEKGLLGSHHFANNPTVPLEKIKIVFNFDMVGTLQEDMFEVFGSNVAVGTREFISRQLTADDPDVDFSTEYLLASDHASLYAKGVPALMFFTGLNCPYHEPEDTIDIINFDGMKQIADIAFRVAFHFADADDLDFLRHIPPREMRRDNASLLAAYHFSVADTMGLTFRSGDDSGETVDDSLHSMGRMFGQALRRREPKPQEGLVVTAVAKDSAAERLGLKRGDRIVTVNGRDVSDADEFDEMIDALLQEEVGMICLRVVPFGEPDSRQRVEITPVEQLPEAWQIVRQGFLYRQSDAEPDTLIVSMILSDKVVESGLLPNDRIMHVNGRRASPETLRESLTAEQTPLLEIERNGKISELELVL